MSSLLGEASFAESVCTLLFSLPQAAKSEKIDIFKKPEHLWRTFSPDQLDMNFKNPAVLLRFIKIMINLVNHGVTIFRLDAIAYLWKESGTKCINLKETHEIIKLFRLICNLLNVESIIVTETNLPEKENISYFGNADEANWIYNFSLPPLLIYSFFSDFGLASLILFLILGSRIF